MRSAGCADLGEYLEALDADPSEWARLTRAMSIQVSRFFRNPSVYAAIKDEVLPAVFEMNRMRGRPSLLVSAGAAKGEEIYSLALLVRHHFKREWDRGTRFLGLDVEAEALQAAGRAVYDAGQVGAIPRRLFKPHFRKGKDGYALTREVADRMEFVFQDLLAGPGFRGGDLVLCRNVLIYYDRERQAEALRGLFRALAPGGFLVLGKTESLSGPARDEFRVVNSTERIYRKPGD
jgi:chemotaxis protein methyltransferase CheR